MPWPPQVEDIKADMRRAPSETRDDDALQMTLDAAVVMVERELNGDFNFSGATTGADALLPPPSADVWLGTARLAGRWHARRNSPDGLVDSAEFGSARVPRFDADLERMLGVGPYRRPMV